MRGKGPLPISKKKPLSHLKNQAAAMPEGHTSVGVLFGGPGSEVEEEATFAAAGGSESKTSDKAEGGGWERSAAAIWETEGATRKSCTRERRGGPQAVIVLNRCVCCSSDQGMAMMGFPVAPRPPVNQFFVNSKSHHNSFHRGRQNS